MQKDQFLLNLDIQVNDVNLAPTDVVHSQISTPGVGSFVHFLERQINNIEKYNVNLQKWSFSVVSQDTKILKYNSGDKNFCITRNPHSTNNLLKLSKGVPIIEECKGRGRYKILIIGENLSDKSLKKRYIENILKGGKIRFVGGLINKINKIEVSDYNEEESQKALKYLMPGTVLVDRHDYLLTYKQEFNLQDDLDALLDFLSLNQYKKKGAYEYLYKKKISFYKTGWFVPMFIGYNRISPMTQNVSGQRFQGCDCCYVEPQYTLGEYVLPIRFQNLDEILWSNYTDKDRQIFIVQQN